MVDDGASTCGRAAKTGAQVLVTDTRVDPTYAPHRMVADDAHYRAVQSTPLLTYHGELIGMVSTHFQHPHRPSDQQLRIMGLFSDVAGEAIASQLNAAYDLDPIGRALVTALLAPAIEPSDSAPSLLAVSPAPSAATNNSPGPVDRLSDHPTLGGTGVVPTSDPQPVDSNVASLSALLHDRFGLGR